MFPKGFLFLRHGLARYDPGVASVLKSGISFGKSNSDSIGIDTSTSVSISKSIGIEAHISMRNSISIGAGTGS